MATEDDSLPRGDRTDRTPPALVRAFYDRVLGDEGLRHPLEAILEQNPHIAKHETAFWNRVFSGSEPQQQQPVTVLLQDIQSVDEWRNLGVTADQLDCLLEHFRRTLKRNGLTRDTAEELCRVLRPIRPMLVSVGAPVGTQAKSSAPPKKTTKKTYQPRAAATPRRETLFSKLGGVKAVKAVVQDMYSRLLEDPITNRFFRDIDLAHLKQHQVEFMKVAFTQIPDDMDVVGFLIEKHMILFKKRGLNEDHFDRVATHFVGACHGVDVPQELIDEAVAIIGPLREIFQEGAVTYGKKAPGAVLAAE